MITAWPALVLGVSCWVEGEKRERRERGLARDGRRGFLFWHEAGHGRFVSLCDGNGGRWKRHKTACASRLRQLSQGIIPGPTDPRRHAEWLRAGLVPQNGSRQGSVRHANGRKPPITVAGRPLCLSQGTTAARATVCQWTKGQARSSRSPRLAGLPRKTRNWFNQTVCRQGSKLSLAQPSAAQCSHQQLAPHNGCSSLASARPGCQSAHCSGGTWAASTGMIAAGHAARWSSGWAAANSQLISAVWFVRAPA